jgi:hypothetical protein
MVVVTLGRCEARRSESGGNSVRAVLLTLALLLAPATAWAQSEITFDEKLMSAASGAVDWVEQPSPDEVRHAAPAEAVREGAYVQVTVECVLNAEGRPHDCRAVSEVPSGHGLGPAAVGLADKYRLAPTDQAITGHHVRIPIHFKFGPPPSRAPISPGDLLWIERAPQIGFFGLILLLLGEAAVIDRLAPPASRVSTVETLREALQFVRLYWLRAPGPGLVLLAIGVGFAAVASHLAAPGQPSPDLTWLPAFFAVWFTGMLMLLVGAGAGYRLGGQALSPGRPGFRLGPLGLQFGGVELRIVAALLLTMAMVFLAELIVAVPLMALFAARVAWAVPVLVLAIFMLLVPFTQRLRLLVPRAALGRGFDIGAAWRLTRGALFVCTLSTVAPMILMLPMLAAGALIPTSWLAPASPLFWAMEAAAVLIYAFVCPLNLGVEIALLRRGEPSPTP